MIAVRSRLGSLGAAVLLGLGASYGANAQTTAETNAPALAPVPESAPANLIPSSEIEMPPDVVTGKGGNVDLHAKIAYPRNPTGLLPAIINIHGGGWSHGKYDSFSCAKVARRGYFVASIEYRFTDVAKWPAQIQDCKLGVRWLRANAAKYHVDPNRIGVWGGSAGGQLVACLGTMADVKEYEGDGGYPGVSSAVQAVVDFFGPTDFTRTDPCSALKRMEELIGVPYVQDPKAWKSASPLFYVKAGDPPTLIVHGLADKTVLPIQSIEFDAALAKAGVEHQLVMVKNAQHGFKPLPGTTIDPSNDQIDEMVYAFFAKHLQTP